ncbi:hypothetical protein LJR078_002395 [Arthrobacter sp. LjRoot78]|uniref:hypothetical protein n=1 Tax=Arthrobacter sp. LjRoot78 TaxID=3342338 RepID=UPI003ED044BC
MTGSGPPRHLTALIPEGVIGWMASTALYHAALRPHLLRWGATRAERAASMPGDSLVADPFVVSTRAVSIRAAPGSIWPWLAQMGDGRGGLYSHDFLDRAFGILSGPSVNRILPEFQQLGAGDVIPLGRGPDWPVAALDRERHLVLEPVPARVSWCFALNRDTNATRLVSRVRIRIYTRPVLWVLAPLIDLVWFIMERRMLLGIRARAERLENSQAPEEQ